MCKWLITHKKVDTSVHVQVKMSNLTVNYICINMSNKMYAESFHGIRGLKQLFLKYFLRIQK